MDDRPAGTPLSDRGLADDDAAEPKPEVEAPAADPRTTIAGRYSVDLTAAPHESGVAVAYLGRDLRTRDPVTVKTLRLEYRGDPDTRARFRREARLLQFLTHPNVIRALAFTEERGAPWLVLERPPGRSLRDEMEQRGPMSPEEVVPVLTGLAAALDHLHARGLVHLDVRPENAIVTPDGDVKLVDFGLAQAAGDAQEPLDGARDEVAYLAPEQVCGEPVSTATDVYALGCIVYEMLTGSPPFATGNTPQARNAAIRARLEQAPRPPTKSRPGGRLPAWVDDVVLGALERDPRQRYGDAASFAAVFLAGVEGDVDVETGRPRRRQDAPRPPRVPINEPGIAVKGSRRLAARRAEPERSITEAPAVIDASFTALSSAAATTQLSGPRIAGGNDRLNLEAVNRRLWQAVILAAVLNVALVAALLITRGEIPGPWASARIGPGATVRIAGTGLVAREAPNAGALIVADLPEGGSVRISGDPVSGDGGPWWPITVETANGTVVGYVPETWVRAP
jgi:serine/threonine protein kinase